MIIRHNISSLNANNRLTQNNKKTNSVLEKLSSGYKINKAGDDAAGLAISEKMRGQIRGLNMVGKNIQDGISLLQTAEGALNEVHSILQRGRELSIQGCNDTLTNLDRSQLQLEINQLNNEINRISNETHFNGISLLNVSPEEILNNSQINDSYKVKWEQNYALTNITESSDGSILGIASGSAYKLNADGLQEWSITEGTNLRIADIKETTDGGYVMLVNNIDSNASDNNKIALVKLDAHRNEQWRSNVSGLYSNEGKEVIETKDGTFFVSGTGGGIQNSDALTALFSSSGIQIKATVSGSPQSDIYAYGDDVLIKAIETSSGEFIGIGNVSLKINNSYTDKDNWVVKYDKNLNLIWDFKIGGSDYDSAEDVIATDNGGVIVVGNYNENGKSSGLIYKLDANGQKLWEQKVDSSFSFNTISRSSQGDYLVGGSLNGIATIFVFDTNGNQKLNIPLKDPTLNGLISEMIIHDNGSITAMANGKSTNVLVDYLTNDQSNTMTKELILQVGANSKQSLSIQLQSINTNSLNLNNIILSTQRDTETSISLFDKAIQIVSSFRSSLGAYQNRLEHANQSVMITSENLQSAESRIRDTDMAKEMMIFTKNNILLQATQSMLAQSNKQPEGILQLLQ
ncbi:flagellin N-terminal helical domain-containing protein [Lysinibacillus fusiformis]|uniref:flagellin N-terminal helical domain-containing protein n=1 Tax=Lysinibacillus fusiformis TaxID=28031 RepID=UPI00263B0735|nr:flagellin [Lysinibacillus fusiformis]MDC6267986.1 flagellin [Lysinibacillus sphaericus]MDN4967524.1 flagellin [Lysinibacillus fusiformis]